MNKMKLKVFFFLVVTLISGYTTYNSVQTNTKLADLSLMNIESLAGENDDMDSGETGGGDSGWNICYNGGPGSTSCTIEAGVDAFGGGVSTGCQVSCESGYYACCGLRCTCKRK